MEYLLWDESLHAAAPAGSLRKHSHLSHCLANLYVSVILLLSL
jgi:hypothetical protein